MTKQNFDHAKEIAATLETKGITSDMPEPIPNPFWAAQEAYYVCQGHRSGKAWRELKEWLTGPAFPHWEYYRKLSEYCQRALRCHDFPEDLRETVADAKGYFRAVADSLRRAEAGMPKS